MKAMKQIKEVSMTEQFIAVVDLLEALGYDVKDFDYFIFVNCAVKGLGNYFLIPTNKIPKNEKNKNKMVGSMTISRNELKKYEISKKSKKQCIGK